MNRATTRLAALALAFATAGALSGCGALSDFDGVASLPLPGRVGVGDGSYTITAELASADAMSVNAPVRVNDVVVGTVTALRVARNHAVATARLAPSVVLPANATARIGQASLLGSKHLELAAPTTVAPLGRLVDGAVIPLARTGALPEVEQVLAALSMVLNGGGVAQIKTITTELDRALSGHQQSWRTVLDQLTLFTSTLDSQRDDINAALDGLDRLSGDLARDNTTLADAVRDLGPGLKVVANRRSELTEALVALGHFSDLATEVVHRSHDDLLANLADLRPTIQALADAGKHLPDSLAVAASPPFSLNTIPLVFRGDYANLYATFDLSLGALNKGLLAGTPLQSVPLGPSGGPLGAVPGVAGQRTNPLIAPLLPDPGADHDGSGLDRSGQNGAGALPVPDLLGGG
jgi:phospholipid/cholesterol/gamma-HCH transport system substrate-binding protein